MKKRLVISSKQLPERLPVVATIAWGLLLDRLHAPGWIWGIVGTLAAIVWIGAIALIFFVEERIELKDLQK